MPDRMVVVLMGSLALMWIVIAPAAWAHPPADHAGEVFAEDAPVSAQHGHDEAAHEQTAPHGEASHDDDHHDDTTHDDGHDHALQERDTGEPGHAHWGENGPQTAFGRAMARLGVLHNVAVHFPVALILAAAAAQLMGAAGLRGEWSHTVRFLVWTGALGGLAAGLLGWAHAGPMSTGEGGVMLAHRMLGSALTISLLGLVALVEWQARRPGRISGLLMPAALYAAGLAVAVNGFLGGSLAHGGLRHLIGG